MISITKKLAGLAGTIISNQQNSWGELTLKSRQSSQYLPFVDNGVGGFPYYFLDPTTLLFNEKTYNWIAASCHYNGESIELRAPFTNAFIEALSSISYQLSTSDEALLASYSDDIATKQMQLVQSWQQSYPSQNNANIDEIIKIITETWATPKTNFDALLQSENLQTLLNEMPVSGQVLLVPLAQYIASINRSLSLLNASSMHTGYLNKALEAAQSSSNLNGGIKTSANVVRPRFSISSSLQQILTTLNDPNANHFDMKMGLTCLGNGLCDSTVDSDQSKNVAIGQMLDVNLNNTNNIISNLPKGAKVSATMQFVGVSVVEFTPEPFDKSQLKNWYWNMPISQAINQDGKDVTGFKFAPHPQIDFSQQGSFGYLTSVAISKHPGVNLTINSSNYQEIATDFTQAKSIDIVFIGRKMAVTLASKNAVVVDSKTQSVTIQLIQADLLLSDNINSTAFVLGVNAVFPNAVSSIDDC